MWPVACYTGSECKPNFRRRLSFIIHTLLIPINTLAFGKLYRQIPPPDVVLQLQVSLEIAKARNRARVKVGKETDDYLEARHRLASKWRRSGTQHVFDIDTDGSLEDTIAHVKQVVWNSL